VTLAGLALYCAIGAAFWLAVFVRAQSPSEEGWFSHETTLGGLEKPGLGPDNSALVLVAGLVFAPLLAALLLLLLSAGLAQKGYWRLRGTRPSARHEPPIAG
jgi:hypothetical protein